ncbi:FKBP-type peptidyl-prolyl cis-trans isomerase [Microbacterium sp. CPCC 204701]|uniref:FKBP-type peptidyl-prolyl cis-trans isomerase n=1 Tax=Microbacterium sp. CPCC 204701 TaxID=2493084 RepID=UPI0013E3559C|nr:FKBP-type peptidyl-prolyl cis-trans isomerase [Microbacterium sp. CPCC 204701]
MRSRVLAALSAAAVTTALLAGCTATDDGTTEVEAAPTVDLCAMAAPSGTVSDGIVVEGEVGSPASVTFAGPLTIPATERTVVVEGDGEKLDGSSLVDYAATVFDAASGALLRAQGYEGETGLPIPAAAIGPFLGCATVGSRLVVAVPATDQEAASVWVLDVLSSRIARATGVDQTHIEGMPTVELAENGAPAVTIPDAEPPAETEVAVLKQGDGPVVEPGDTVMLHHTGVRWSDGSVIDSTWATGAPATIVTTEAVRGYQQGLEGHTIGSQVLVVIPPGQAYGEGEINDEDLTGETIVFVADLLDVLPAA